MNLPYFNAADCLRCAQASADAYTLAGSSAIPQTVIQAAVTDTQGIIRVFPDVTIIALRGTTNLQDVLTDIKICRSEGVHRGVKEAVKSIYSQVWCGTEFEKPLLITGHSLGGGLAMEIAGQLAFDGFQIQGVYTFGQLRIFNAARRDQYNLALGHRTFRLVNHCDPVPHMPGPLIGYRHAGHEIFWRDGRITVDPSPWLKIGRALIGGMSLLAVPGNLIGISTALARVAQAAGDHPMADYMGIAYQLYLTTQSTDLAAV